jgi:hypothetical protein
MRVFGDSRIRLANLRFFCAFIGLFLLLSNGRMDAGDANAQLQGTFNLVRSGSLGMDTPSPDPAIQSLFVRSPSGRYFEAHDIGNSLLMVPAVVVAVASSRMLPGMPVPGVAGTYGETSLILAKTLCSFTDTIVSAIACYFLYLLFGLFIDQRKSVLMALLFAFGTFFAGYFRAAWDVVPACNACCIMLFFLVRIRTEDKPPARVPLLAVFCCGVACSFRYSLLPFFTMSMILFLWRNRGRLSVSTRLWAVLIFAVTSIPTMVFNWIRMGSILIPATVSPQFADQNGLTNHIVSGGIGLLFSPNRGLFVFSPIVLLIFALPWRWKALPESIRELLICFAPGIFLYYLLIARLRNWGAAGWGPRYLLPIFPVLFVVAGFVLAALWNRSRVSRMWLAPLVAISLGVAVPAIVVDYTDAGRDDWHSTEMTAAQSRQITDTLKSLADGIGGRRRASAGTRAQFVPAVFPDLVATRVAALLRRKSLVLEMAFVAFYVLLLGALIFYLFWRCRDKSDAVNGRTATRNGPFE